MTVFSYFFLNWGHILLSTWLVRNRSCPEKITRFVISPLQLMTYLLLLRTPIHQLPPRPNLPVTFIIDNVIVVEEIYRISTLDAHNLLKISMDYLFLKPFFLRVDSFWRRKRGRRRIQRMMRVISWSFTQLFWKHRLDSVNVCIKQFNSGIYKVIFIVFNLDARGCFFFGKDGRRQSSNRYLLFWFYYFLYFRFDWLLGLYYFSQRVFFLRELLGCGFWGFVFFESDVVFIGFFKDDVVLKVHFLRVERRIKLGSISTVHVWSLSRWLFIFFLFDWQGMFLRLFRVFTKVMFCFKNVELLWVLRFFWDDEYFVDWFLLVYTFL